MLCNLPCCVVEGLGVRDVVLILQGRRKEDFAGSSLVFVTSCLQACGIDSPLHAKLVKAALVR
jgi:hypothetical protein